VAFGTIRSNFQALENTRSIEVVDPCSKGIQFWTQKVPVLAPEGMYSWNHDESDEILRMVCLLLEYGADLNVKDDMGMSPGDYAVMLGQDNLRRHHHLWDSGTGPFDRGLLARSCTAHPSHPRQCLPRSHARNKDRQRGWGPEDSQNTDNDVSLLQGSLHTTKLNGVRTGVQQLKPSI